MIHKTAPSFWSEYKNLPAKIQNLADENFALLKSNSYHPSLHFKKVGKYWSVRIGISYRALAIEKDGVYIWFWVGFHTYYDKIVH